MRHIIHSETVPTGIAAAFRAEPHPTKPRQAWDDFDKAAKRELREHLWELQYGLCAYCERALDLGPGTSSVEHIVPKTSNPRFTFLYTNLVLCCVDPKTCNLRKKASLPVQHQGSGKHQYDNPQQRDTGFQHPAMAQTVGQAGLKSRIKRHWVVSHDDS